MFSHIVWRRGNNWSPTAEGSVENSWSLERDRQMATRKLWAKLRKGQSFGGESDMDKALETFVYGDRGKA